VRCASRSGQTDWHPMTMLSHGLRVLDGSVKSFGSQMASSLKSVWHVDRLSPRVGPAPLLQAHNGKTLSTAFVAGQRGMKSLYVYSLSTHIDNSIASKCFFWSFLRASGLRVKDRKMQFLAAVSHRV
jgi:hypothetical protein